jgi:putative nucleotidyltransferase with HDIG domain
MSSESAVAHEPEARLSPRPWSQIVESIPQNRVAANAATHVALLVTIVALLACLAAWELARTLERPSASEIQAVVVLFSLGLAAQILTFRQSAGVAGSVATIPYAATAFIVPTALAVAAAGCASLVVQRYHRRPLVKAAFNIAQTVLAMACSVFAFRSVGGIGLLHMAASTLKEVVFLDAVPAVALVGALLTVNTVTVSAVVALSQRSSLLPVLRSSIATAVPFFALTALLAFYLAWLYTKGGAFGAIGLAVPMLAVRQLYRTTTELTNVSEELLDLMVAAIDARDPYTSGHSKRVSRAARVIAKALGLSDREVERIAVAALLHDIGKIDKSFTPILTKEGKLTPEEWEIMRQHPIRSAELVGLVSSFRDVVDGVRHHHEKWDGTGYPDGIAGDRIPLASRIIVFADTLDAMTTDRPYRRALDLSEARAELIRFRGKQFDPEICDRILSSETWSVVYACFEENLRRGVRIQAV